MVWSHHTRTYIHTYIHTYICHTSYAFMFASISGWLYLFGNRMWPVGRVDLLLLFVCFFTLECIFGFSSTYSNYSTLDRVAVMINIRGNVRFTIIWFQVIHISLIYEPILVYVLLYHVFGGYTDVMVNMPLVPIYVCVYVCEYVYVCVSMYVCVCVCLVPLC